MKKLLICLLALLLAAFPALAMYAATAGLQVDVTGMELLDEYQGQTDLTHVYLAVYTSLTNWNPRTVRLADALGAELTYEGIYTFAAELDFPVEELEQLARIDGALVFRIPTLVADAAPEGLTMTLTVEGEAVPQSVTLEGYRPAYGGSLEDPGYDSPKEAVTAYLEALKNGDARGMLSTFAIETYVSEMDAQAELERYGAFIPTIGIRVPLGGDYQQQVAVAARYGQLAESLAYQWMLFSWPEGYEEFGGTTISLTEDGAAEAFLTNLAENDAAARWQEMEVVGFVEPELMSTQYSDGAESRARQAASHGCDEIVSVVAKLDIGGEEWYQCMDVARYGEKWYNLSLIGYIGHLLGLSLYSGGLVPAAAF